MKQSLIIALAVFAGALAVSAATVEQYAVFEASFTHTGSYSNPYSGVSTATVTLVSPSSVQKTIPLFWDGGSTWKLRFSPDQAGTWTYSTSSTDAGLNNKTGSFICVASSLPGGIQAMTDHPYHFQTRSGEPFFFFGDTGWSMFGSNVSENLNHATVIHYIDTRAAQGFNYIHTNVMMTSGNEGGLSFNSVSSETLNPAFFQEVDSRLQYANSKGITVGFMLAWANGDPSWDDFSNDAARLRYARYCVARYSAHNVLFIVSGEWNETGTKSMYQSIGTEIMNTDPHDRLIGIHSTGSVEEFATDSWMSFGDYQQIYSSLHSKILSSRDHNKQVVNSEYAYYLRDQDGDGTVDKPNSATLKAIRDASWDIVMAGGYFVTGWGTTYYGGTRDPGPFNVDDPRNDDWEEDVQHIQTLFESLDFWTLNPNDSLLAGSGTRYCLADTGRLYVAYVRGNSGTNSLSLNAMVSGAYSVSLFNPRTGAFAVQPSYAGLGPITLDPPDSDDWVFIVSATGGTNQAPTVSISANKTTLSPGESVLFSVVASDPDGAIVSFQWNWGNQTETGVGSPATSVSHSWPSAGDYNVTLEVTDNGSAAQTTTSNMLTIHVVDNLPPTISAATATPNSGTVPLTVQFTVTASDPEGDPLTYQWDFDGNGTWDATGSTVSHVYSNAGHFDPLVRVTATGGADVRQLTIDAEGVIAGDGTILVNDPLNGTTIGTADGSGAFTDGGWKSTGGRIIYDAGKQITDGYFEAKMWGWTAPAQGTDKSHPLSGWETEGQYGHYLEDGCFWNWRIGTGYDPFKVLATPVGLDSRVEARVGSNSAVNDGQKHVYRVEWKSGVVSFWFDGVKLQQWTFDHFTQQYFVIGRDLQYGITNPAPIIGDVKIVDRSGGGNVPPTVDAGANQTITLPTNSVNLNGTVTDPDDTTTTSWSMVSGPGSVAFGNASAVDTTVSFTSAGTYVLKLEADDGVNPPVSDTVTITVNSEPVNIAPTVEAGSNQSITLPANSVSLNGTVTDPDNSPTTLWSKVSGPGTVTFGNPSLVDTTATFSAAGSYILSLTADDGTNDPVSDTVSIIVNSASCDTDGDGMDDDWEIAQFGDLSHNGATDEDSDGLTNLEEYIIGTHPLDSDTDGDGLTDGVDPNPLLPGNSQKSISRTQCDMGYRQTENPITLIIIGLTLIGLIMVRHYVVKQIW
ncbi:MAG: DUF4038 domain-containing protein [Planctomycetota bacterium]